MKYLFINCLAGIRSTGRITADKCRELMREGHECLLAYGRGIGNCDDVPTIQIGTALDYHIHALRSRLLDDMGFGSRRATEAFLHRVREYDPDVIWLHNIHGYYIHIGLLFEYLRSCGKRILWTLHDCWSFTGHCAYFDFAGCDRWKTGCHHCPQKGVYPASLLRDNSRGNYEKKRELFTQIPNLTILTPSRWLADLVKQSFLKEYPVEVVYNTIDTKVFKPTESDFRRSHNLLGKRMVLGVAAVWDARKGMPDFLKLAQKMGGDYKIVLVGLTQKQMNGLPANILGLGRTNSARELAEIYSAADVFVNPTYEDNYPTVNLEARACGTPVISYDTGGSRETVGEGDWLVPKGDVDALAEIIQRIN